LTCVLWSDAMSQAVVPAAAPSRTVCVETLSKYFVVPDLLCSVHPFLHDAANRSVSTDQTRSLTVPDIPSYSIYTGGVSSPLAGSGGASGGGVSNSRRCPSTSCVDFVSEYQRPEHRGRWDAVVTCFFLDTAKNPLEYIRTIAHCLKPGTGVWINTGPLLWHEATGAPPYDCLQLTAQELLQATELAGHCAIQQQNYIYNLITHLFSFESRAA
jgi:hypothetical protein